ncbi:winged helix-turn-helix domain-containing protein [Enterococcus sp. AZ109]|uniref:winged helix-turn-helix domain-containing protein n=1 Tax=Enterococcus sp. AZ109 TaxID=2774634 RepID=UPI003F1E6C6B
MEPILILTKNLLVERRLQEQLQYLNYEVFCSTIMFHKLLKKGNHSLLVRDYRAIIFSETISNDEVCRLLNNLKGEEKIIFRKFPELPEEQEEEELTQLGISQWIWEEQSLNVLREKLAPSAPVSAEKVAVLFNKIKDAPKRLTDFKKILTGKEYSIFECLSVNKGEVVSRQDLVDYIWAEPARQARLSQISIGVKTLNQKLLQIGFQDKSIETIWGKGYRLSPELWDYCKLISDET